MTPCQFLEWDSAFFGRRIARVNAPVLTAEALNFILRWCQEERIDCLYFLAPADDDTTVRLAETNGFHQVDLRLTYRAKLTTALINAPSATNIRYHRDSDLDALRALARRSFRDSRFYYDGHFPHERCDDLYQTWLEKNAADPNGALLVAEANGAIAGFITCGINSAGSGDIGLVAVDAAYQGQGNGRRLVSAALDWFQAHGASAVSVVTQGRNVAAQRLYGRAGFLVDDVRLWYHRWFG